MNTQKTPLEIASINVEWLVERLWLEKSVSADIIKVFNTPEFEANLDFSVSEIYDTLREKGYFEATRKQIWSLTNHEMTKRELEVINEILQTYAYNKEIEDKKSQ